MADPGSGIISENLVSESDSEAMHVDLTPTASDREDETQPVSTAKQEDHSFVSLFKDISQEKLEQRAQRFGVDISPLRNVTEVEVKALYKSFEIDLKDVAGTRAGKVRLNAIHIRGVEEMNTQDVFDYFKEQTPDSVEWINDHACNVVWLDPLCAARALLTFSQPIKRSQLSKGRKDGSTEDLPGEEVAIVSEPEEGEDVEMTEQESILPTDDQRTRCPSGDSDSQLSHCRRNSGDPSGRTPVPNNSPIDSSQIEESSSSDIGIEIDSSKIDIPIPPGPWRLGVSNNKSKAILLRFAYRSDRKTPGAEKLSQYYLKYGNPNYKGLKGIISTSLKRKIKDEYKRPTYVDLDAVVDDEFQHHTPNFEMDYIGMKEPSKRPRMRMYADEEEEKSKQRLSLAQSTSSALHPADLRNRISYEKHSVQSSYETSDSGDLRSKLSSRSRTSSEGDSRSGHKRSVAVFHTDLSKPIVIGDLRSKLEQLRQARQPKVPLLIEVSQEDV